MSEQGRPGRYQRSFSGMVGALLVLVLVIGGYAAFRAIFRDDLVVTPEAVDYLDSVALAQEAQLPVAYPPTLPEGWIATGVDIDASTGFTWALKLLTDDQRFVGVRQDPGELGDLISTYVDEDAVEGEEVTLDSEVASSWRVWTDVGGDTAYVAEVPPGHLMVYGSAPPEQLRELIGTLTTDPLP